MKKALSLFLALMLCVGILTVPASAEEDRNISEWAKSGQPETGLIMFSQTSTPDTEFSRRIKYTSYGLKRADGSVVFDAIYDKIYCAGKYIAVVEGGYIAHSLVPPRQLWVYDLNMNLVYNETLEDGGELIYLDDINAYLLWKSTARHMVNGDPAIIFDSTFKTIREFQELDGYMGGGYFKEETSRSSSHTPPNHPAIYRYAGGTIRKLSLNYRFVNYAGNGLLYAMNDDGMCGVVDDNNRVVVPFIYEFIERASEESAQGYLRVGRFTDSETKDYYYNDGYLQLYSYNYLQFGLIDLQGTVVLPIEYDDLLFNDEYDSLYFDDIGYVMLGKWDGTYVPSSLAVVGGPTTYERHIVYTFLYLKSLYPTKFRDVFLNAWYADAVNWAIDNNITVGTSDTTFSPDATCTNAQILTFLWRAKGEPEPNIHNPYTGISESNYYYKAALWGYENGLIDNLFDPGAPCTRASTVTYLWKTAGSPAAGRAAFTDVVDGAEYAQAVAWAVAQSITNGTDDTHFSPDATCTRGQIVTFLYRDFV